MRTLILFFTFLFSANCIAQGEIADLMHKITNYEKQIKNYKIKLQGYDAMKGKYLRLNETHKNAVYSNQILQDSLEYYQSELSSLAYDLDGMRVQLNNVNIELTDQTRKYEDLTARFNEVNNKYSLIIQSLHQKNFEAELRSFILSIENNRLRDHLNQFNKYDNILAVDRNGDAIMNYGEVMTPRHVHQFNLKNVVYAEYNSGKEVAANISCYFLIYHNGKIAKTEPSKKTPAKPFITDINLFVKSVDKNISTVFYNVTADEKNVKKIILPESISRRNFNRQDYEFIIVSKETYDQHRNDFVDLSSAIKHNTILSTLTEETIIMTDCIHETITIAEDILQVYYFDGDDIDSDQISIYLDGAGTVVDKKTLGKLNLTDSFSYDINQNSGFRITARANGTDYSATCSVGLKFGQDAKPHVYYIAAGKSICFNLKKTD